MLIHMTLIMTLITSISFIILLITLGIDAASYIIVETVPKCSYRGVSFALTALVMFYIIIFGMVIAERINKC